jgi:predicted  nucleic acid-binding Zn-ribbon protein
MNELHVLIELQSVHDNLRTIQRDLSAFPPDLAALDAELKILARKSDEATRGLAATRALLASLSVELTSAEKAEELAKTAVKGASQKLQYTTAIRELDDRQRQKAAVARPVKEAETRIEALERQIQEVSGRQAEAQKQFDELKSIFLAEHENQVTAQTKLLARQAQLEAEMDPGMITKFGRLLQQRQGRAVVGVDNGACGGCRTRLRTPFIAQLRTTGSMFCESCQRILYDPAAKQ